MKERIKKEIKEWINAIIYAVIFGTIIRLFVFETMMVPTPSMVPTIQVGDRLFIEKITYMYKEPQIGDIVVFWTPFVDKKAQEMLRAFDKFMDFFAPREFKGHVKYVKRLIAKSGDTVKLVPTKEPWEKIKKYGLEKAQVPNWIKLLVKRYGSVDKIPERIKRLVSKVQINGKTPPEFENIYYIKDGIFVSPHYYSYIAYPDKYRKEIADYFYRTNLQSFYLEFLRYYSKNLSYTEYYDSVLKNYMNNIKFDEDGNVVIKIPKGFLFFMGDNTAESFDSRYFGFVPEKNVIGLPFLRIWPFDRFGPF